MARILCDERVVEYTTEFKSKVVELTQGLNVQAIDIAQILDLYRQWYADGDRNTVRVN